MKVNDLVEIVVVAHGYPRWMAMLEIELMLLSALAARDRLIAAGFTHLAIDIRGLGAAS